MSQSSGYKGFQMQSAGICSLPSATKEPTAPPRLLLPQRWASKFLWKLLTFSRGVSRPPLLLAVVTS